MPVHGYGARTGASRIARGSNPSTVPVDPATWSAIEIAICVFRNFSIMVKLRFSTFAFFANLQFPKFAIFAARLWLGQNSKFGGSLIRAYGGHLGGTQGTEIVMGRGAYHHWFVACEAMEGGAFLHCFWHFVDQPQSRDGDGVGRSFANKCGGRDFVIEYGRWRVRQTYRFVVLWSPAFRAALGRCIRFPAWIMDVCEGPSRFFGGLAGVAPSRTAPFRG